VKSRAYYVVFSVVQNIRKDTGVNTFIPDGDASLARISSSKFWFGYGQVIAVHTVLKRVTIATGILLTALSREIRDAKAFAVIATWI
jgi:hypothetical protein